MFFVTLGKGQFKVKVKIEGEKNIYIIQTKTLHYLSSIEIDLWSGTPWHMFKTIFPRDVVENVNLKSRCSAGASGEKSQPFGTYNQVLSKHIFGSPQTQGGGVQSFWT